MSEAACLAMEQSGIPKTSGRVSVDVAVRVAVPKSYSKRERVTALLGGSYPHTDLDNHYKVVDALNNVVWTDDRQIVTLSATKAWVDGPEGEGLSITVRYLDPVAPVT